MKLSLVIEKLSQILAERGPETSVMVDFTDKKRSEGWTTELSFIDHGTLDGKPTVFLMAAFVEEGDEEEE